MMEPAPAPRPNDWNPGRYARHAGFVPALARDLVTLANPAPGDRVLDLGCGDGVLAVDLVARGARVVGLDASAAMVEAARARGIDAVLGTAERLPFDAEFDVVFSNAVLHWTRDIDAVLAGVVRALRPGGRFVGEFGGDGCVASIRSAAAAVLERRGIPAPVAPWYFPSAETFAAALVRAGFTADRVWLFPRPTVLPTGVVGWLETFGGPLLDAVPPADRADIAAEIQASLPPANRNEAGAWVADYVRLRFVARTGRTQAPASTGRPIQT